MIADPVTSAGVLTVKAAPVLVPWELVDPTRSVVQVCRCVVNMSD